MQPSQFKFKTSNSGSKTATYQIKVAYISKKHMTATLLLFIIQSVSNNSAVRSGVSNYSGRQARFIEKKCFTGHIII